MQSRKDNTLMFNIFIRTILIFIRQECGQFVGLKQHGKTMADDQDYKELILRNNNTLKGTIKVRQGSSAEQVKGKVLDQQGIKNQDSFQLNHHPDIKITQKSSLLILTQHGEKRNSTKSNPSRKMSADSSVYEVSSMDYDDEAKEFLAVQPQKPPIVRGRVQKCNKLFCCFSSVLHLQLNITQLKIYSNDRYEHQIDSISINTVAKLRSYRKKDFFFIRMDFVEGGSMDLKFSNMNLCKEWMGYLIQAMTFNKYLNERRTFSKADSFRNFLKSLNGEGDTRIVTLEQSNQQLRTIYSQLPQEKVMVRQSKKFVKVSEFQVRYRIGSGAFSVVFLAQRKNRLYALKQLNKQKLLLRNQMKYAITQLRTLIKCRGCKYIIPLYFAFQTPQNLYMALEYIPTGDLSQHIKDFGPFKPEQALIILTELVYAIEYLHKHKIIYRDLKPENIMIDARGHIALIDFGLAKELDNEQDYAESFLGTPLYLAPERFQGGGQINFKSDIYGVGCIFYEMLHGESPFHSSNYHSLINRIKNDTPEIRKDLPEDYIFFLLGTLEKDPQKRMSCMSQHKIFGKTNWKDVAAKAHRGINNDYPEKRSSAYLSSKIDEDYNEFTFPLKLVADWDFNYEAQ